jgi:hypothetical protein
LGHRFAHREVLASREDEPPRTRIPIDFLLKVGDQLGHSLDFIQNGSAANLGEKATGILHGEAAMIRRFEGSVGHSGKEPLAQGRFARLARTGEGDDGILAGAPLDEWSYPARDHGWKIAVIHENAIRLHIHDPR